MTQPVRGPDDQMYQFPEGTTKEAAIRYFKSKGIGKKKQDVAQTQTQQEARPAPKQSLVSRVMDWSNRGLISPDRALQILSLGEQGKGSDWTVEKLKEYRDAPPSLKAKHDVRHIPGFGDINYDQFVAGVRASGGETVSSLTSPSSLATAALARAAKLPGSVGKLARTALTAMGLQSFGSGAKSTYEGIEKGVKTPEGSTQALLGASQMASSAPAVTTAKRFVKSGASKLFPALGTGEGSFIASLRPPVKQIPELRSAYRRTLPDLRKANISTFDDLKDFAEQRKIAVAKNTASEIARAGGTFTIDPHQVGKAVRSRVTDLMKVRATKKGKLPIEARMIQREAENIERNLAITPKTLPEAEQLVQDLNQVLADFRKLPPDARYKAIRTGDPEAIFTAVKENIQSQIESQMSGYKDQKADYGAYKELQRHAERRIDELERQLGQTNMLQRRAGESFGGAIGALFSGQYLHGVADILFGRGMGDVYLEMMTRPDRMLKRSLSQPLEPVPFTGQVAATVAEGVKREEEKK